ncbi:MAG: hypothetical protein IAE67_10930 [Candidatus Competibacteraceae bacterium]|nr:hypothetical protein [Candidatus Competibacteraceae bacterium]
MKNLILITSLFIILANNSFALNEYEKPKSKKSSKEKETEGQVEYYGRGVVCGFKIENGIMFVLCCGTEGLCVVVVSGGGSTYRVTVNHPESPVTYLASEYSEDNNEEYTEYQFQLITP